jgi:hypothetical protein
MSVWFAKTCDYLQVRNPASITHRVSGSAFAAAKIL